MRGSVGIESICILVISNDQENEKQNIEWKDCESNEIRSLWCDQSCNVDAAVETVPCTTLHVIKEILSWHAIIFVAASISQLIMTLYDLIYCHQLFNNVCSVASGIKN